MKSPLLKHLNEEQKRLERLVIECQQRTGTALEQINELEKHFESQVSEFREAVAIETENINCYRGLIRENIDLQEEYASVEDD